MGQRLKLAIIGCSDLIYNFLYDCTKHLPIELVAICDNNPEKMEAFSRRYNAGRLYSDYKRLLKEENLDAVICYPSNIGLHYEMAKECMLSNVNVFIERPPCLTEEQARDLIAVQSKTGKYTMTRFNRRYTDSYVMAKEILQRNEFGNVTMYLAKYQASPYDSEESFVNNHIIHHLDLARFLLGKISITHVDRVKIDDNKVGYNISFVTQYGGIGIIQSGSLQNGTYPMERVEITGDGRNITVDNIKKIEYNRPSAKRERFSVQSLEDGKDCLSWNPNNGNMSHYTYYGFENELHNFVYSTIKGIAPSPDITDTVHTIELLEIVRQSMYR